ncbi:MAG TPA: hypothetical protein VMD77_01900 [Candidatus Baltobacteraceae bacterium]|nr:hypothetical protein [Candidatus Baltobacteraceae bacterium]
MMWLFVSACGLLLQLGVLLQGLRARLIVKYSFFYAYVFSTFLATILAFILWKLASASAYQKGYWIMQFATLLLGCGIILEIFRHALSPYKGAEKFATAVGLFTFGGVFCFALGYRLVVSSPDRALFELERNVRTVQALLLFGIFAVISYYGIPLGKNIKGMIAGYGLYIITSLFALALRVYAGPRFNSIWNVVQPLSFVGSFAIWLAALWSFYPNPAPDPAIPLENDYEALATRTRRTLASMRSHLTRTARS